MEMFSISWICFSEIENWFAWGVKNIHWLHDGAAARTKGVKNMI